MRSMMPEALRLARCFSMALAEIPIFAARATALNVPSSASRATIFSLLLGCRVRGREAYDLSKVCVYERKDLYICKRIETKTMEITNLLHYAKREELRRWLEENHDKVQCCWVVMHRGKCPEWPAIPYIEVVEEALCFGWIDSTLKRLPDGRLAQRLSPRRPRSHWTELNMERCRSLEERGLMTEAGRRALATGQEMAEKNKLK